MMDIEILAHYFSGYWRKVFTFLKIVQETDAQRLFILQISST